MYSKKQAGYKSYIPPASVLLIEQRAARRGAALLVRLEKSGENLYLPFPKPLTDSAIPTLASLFKSVDAGVIVMPNTAAASVLLKTFSKPNAENKLIAFVAVFRVRPRAIISSMYCFISPMYCFFGSMYCSFSSPLMCIVRSACSAEISSTNFSGEDAAQKLALLIFRQVRQLVYLNSDESEI